MVIPPEFMQWVRTWVAGWVNANFVRRTQILGTGSVDLGPYTLTMPYSGTPVMTTGDQTVAGAKTFSSAITSIGSTLSSATSALLSLVATGSGGRSWQIGTSATGSTPVGTTAGDLYIYDVTSSKLVAFLTQTGILKVLSPTTAALRVSATGSGGREWYWAASVTGQTPVGTTAGDIYLWDVTAGALHSTYSTGGSAWFANNVSALSFTDRTKGYEGDALKDLAGVRAKNGEIDHSTLPAFAVHENGGRDLGAMISMLTVAVQQLTAKVEELDKRYGRD